MTTMITDEHLLEIAKEISKIVQERASLLNTITNSNYRVRDIRNVSVLKFVEKPDLKNLFRGQSSHARVEGTIYLNYWRDEDNHGYSPLTVKFWTDDVFLTYDTVEDLFIVDNNFNFYPHLQSH